MSVRTSQQGLEQEGDHARGLSSDEHGTGGAEVDARAVLNAEFVGVRRAQILDTRCLDLSMQRHIFKEEGHLIACDVCFGKYDGVAGEPSAKSGANARSHLRYFFCR